jgi:hypothetical protein
MNPVAAIGFTQSFEMNYGRATWLRNWFIGTIRTVVADHSHATCLLPQITYFVVLSSESRQRKS